MKILRNYVLKECILPFFIALGVLTSVFLLGYLIQLAHLVINKGVSLSTIGKVFLFYIPFLLGYTLPIACLVAVILGFSRLSADNEILAIRTSGIVITKLLVPLTVVGVIFSLITFILGDRVVPYAHFEQKKLLKSLGVKNPTALLEPGVFISAFDKQVIFIHRISENKMYNVTIWQPQPDGRPTRTIIAKRGEFSRVPGKEQIILKLIDGTSDEPDLKNPNNFYKLNFKTFFMTLDIPQEDKKIEKKPRSMTLAELQVAKIKYEKLLIETAPLETEFYRKINWSFSPMIFILIGFPLAVITNRREKTANIGVAVACAAVYYLLSLACEAVSMENMAPARWLMWLPNVVGLLAIVYFYRRLGRI